VAQIEPLKKKAQFEPLKKEFKRIDK